MTPELSRQMQAEFIAGFEAKLAGRSELPVPGGLELLSVLDLRRVRRYGDQEREVRRAAAGAQKPDRTLLDRLPLNPAAGFEFRRRGLFREVRLMAAAAACVADIEALAAGRPVGPAGPAELQEALNAIAALGLAGGAGAPLLAGIFSPTGWTPETAAVLPDDTVRRVVLVAKNPDGTWTVTERDGRTTSLSDLFDPETETRKLSRAVSAVRTAVEALPAGEPLHIADLAAKLRVPGRLLSAVAEDFIRRHEDLRMLEASGKRVLYRTPMHVVAPTLLERIWPFAQSPAARLELLCEQRTRLQVYRRQVWTELDNLQREQERLMESGRTAATEPERRRLASLLAGVRRECRHRRRLVEVADRQIEILSGHLHNIELVTLGQIAGTPTAEDIQQVADQAQKVIAELAADTRLIEETAPDPASMSAEEEAILREFEHARDAELAGLVIRPEPPQVEPRVAESKAESAKPRERQLE